MTKEETKVILSVLKAGYPNFYKDLKRDDADQIINLWSTMFADDSAKIVTEAVKSLMCTLKFPPTIADVKEKIILITQPQTETELEAWGKVLKAIQNANYQAQEYFDNFLPTIQKLVGSPGQLREWAMMESEIVNSVIQSNFMRSYSARVKQEKEYSALPDSTKELIETTKARLLGDGN
jgi:hypothetical protein